MPNTPFLIDLGCEVEDKITGLIGMITARAQNLYGCNTYYITPKVGTDQKIMDGLWRDEQGIRLLSIPKKQKVAGPSAG